MTVTKKNNKSDLPLVPESVLKKRHDLDDLALKRRAAQELQAATSKGTNNKNNKAAFYVKKPETILARARSRRNYAKRFKRVLRKGMQKRASNQPEFAETTQEDEMEDDVSPTKYQSNSVAAPMVFVVRIRNSVGAPKEVLKVLARLGLRNLHEAVFCKYDDEYRKLLHLVEPYVVYGPVSQESTVADLIQRRGYAKIDGERVPLSDNTVIEKALGEYGIVCKEDLVHEIFTAGDNFVVANKFLWPFRLSDSKTKFERKTLKLKDGKDYGDRGEAIMEYIQQVL